MHRLNFLGFFRGYKPTTREEEVGGGDSVGGCGVGRGARQIKGEDREEHLKGRNVNHKAVRNYVWTRMLPSRGIPGRQLWVALHSGGGGTHSWKASKHVNEPYSGCLFTTTFSQKENKLPHLTGVPSPDF